MSLKYEPSSEPLQKGWRGWTSCLLRLAALEERARLGAPQLGLRHPRRHLPCEAVTSHVLKVRSSIRICVYSSSNRCVFEINTHHVCIYLNETHTNGVSGGRRSRGLEKRARLGTPQLGLRHPR